MTSFFARALVIAVATATIQLTAQPATRTGGGTWTVPAAAQIDAIYPELRSPAP